jgi:hypothetical protein
MKKILCIVFLMAASAYGQVSGSVNVTGGVLIVSSAPSGACAQGVANQQMVTTGIQYSCQNITAGTGTWAIQSWQKGSTNYATGGGTAQAQTLTLTPPISSNAAGTVVVYLPSVANTATAPTLAVSGLAAQTVTVCGTAAMLAGDLTTTTIAHLVSDGTRWQLENPAISNCGSVVTTLQAGTGVPLTGAVINATQSNVAGTTQLNIQNTSSDNAASSDVVATCDDGSNTTCYIDMGINSSTYNQSAYSSGAHGDGYLLVMGGSANAGGNLAIGTATAGKVVTVIVGGTATANVVGQFNTTGLVLGGNISYATQSSSTNCSSAAAPAVCAASSAGSVVVAAAGTTVVVNTTAVTANSQIFVQEDSSLGAKLSVTCNVTPATAPPTITARVAATSFTITTTAPTTNPRCFSYEIIN